MSYPFILQGTNIIVVIGNTPHTVSKTHISYDKIKEALKAEDWDAVKDLINPKQVILNYGDGNVSINGGVLCWKGVEMKGGLSNQMIAMFKEGFPIGPMVKFMENLMDNPSNRAVQELYNFTEKGQMPITEDGCMLAYKRINDNYTDVYSSKVLNTPLSCITADQLATLPRMSQGIQQNVTTELVGNNIVVSMPRNAVNDDADQACSHGLHFCSKNYLSEFRGSRIIIVKINPRDVVSIPKDHAHTKGRTCRYEIVGELNVDVAPEEAFTSAVQNTVSPEAAHGAYTSDYASW